jgi:hypothetical protein
MGSTRTTTEPAGASNDTPIELCEFCRDGRTGEKREKQPAAYWVKTGSDYGQACLSCTDDLWEQAPFQCQIVHDLPGQYNVDVLEEPKEVFGEDIVEEIQKER